LLQTDRWNSTVNTAKVGDTTVHKYEFQRFSQQEIIDVALDTIKQQLYVLHGENTRRDDFFTLVIFDTLANLLSSHTIRLTDGNRPVQARIKFNQSGKPFIFGTYNLSSERQRIEALSRITESAGFFSMTLDNIIRLQNYADFDNVDQQISPTQAQTLRQRRGRRQQPFSMDFFMSLRLETIGDNVLMIGESVTPEYRTATRTFYDYYGRVVPHTTTVFDGYRYNDAFIWVLDSNGNVRGNHMTDISMALNSKTLLNKTAYFVGENEVAIKFVNATNAFYKTLQPYETSFQSLRLQPLHRTDRIIEDHDSRILNWYDSNFLVVGYQTIQNNQLRGENRRVVFYLSKITLD
jgi:hypothetical protein